MPKLVTDRQREAMLLRKQGLTYKQVGRRMGMTPGGATRATRIGVHRWYGIPSWVQIPPLEFNDLLGAIPIAELITENDTP